MVGVPVIINHKDLNTDNVNDERVGVVNSVWYDEKDGWYWCDGIIWDETAQNLITDKNWSVSCSYDVKTANDEGGSENNIPYDMEFLDGVFTHLALVNNPRYERANIVFNSKTVVLNDAEFESKHPRDEQGRFTNIPTDNNGYSIKLVKSQRESINMEKAMSKGFYPEEQVRITLSGATKAGKELKRLFDENKKYKTNFRINYAYKDNNFNDWIWDGEIGDFAPSAKPVYFDTEEEANEWIKKQGDNIVNPKVKQVEEWHHISGGGRNKLIDINDLVKLGFKVDTSTANKKFKLKIFNSKDNFAQQFTDIFFEALAEVIVENSLGE